MKKGIIANSGKIQRLNENSVSIGGTISKNDLNYYLLYWDKIVMPTNNIFHYQIPDEEAILKTGILERPIVKFSSWTTNVKDGSYDPFVIAQSIVANELISKDKLIDWTIHQIGDQVVIANEQRKEFESIKVDLLNCLPVPSETVSFNEVLEFKAKRIDELAALHSTIDDLYLEIIKSPDRNFQEKKSISELNKAIENLNKVSNEKFKFLTNYNLTVELNFNGKDIAMALGGGALFDFYTSGMTIPIGTILLGIASLVEISANRTTSVEKAKDKFKLNFLADATKRNII